MNTVLSSSDSSINPKEGNFLAILVCLFITFLIIAKVASEKYFPLMNAPVSCRDIVYPLTFLIVHIATALYGPQQGRMLITHGLSISVIVSILLWIARELPIAAESPVSIGDFEKVLGSSISLTISSLGVYLVSHSLNLYLFTGLQGLFSQRTLWLRSIVTSLGAQFVDVILLALALYALGATPTGPASFFSQMFSQYALKVMVTLLIAPFLYTNIVLVHQQPAYKTAQ